MKRGDIYTENEIGDYVTTEKAAPPRQHGHNEKARVSWWRPSPPSGDGDRHRRRRCQPPAATGDIVVDRRRQRYELLLPKRRVELR